MNDEQQMLYDFLNTNYRGRENAVTSDKIREALGLEWGRTEEATRELIRDMVINLRSPVGSSAKGFLLLLTLKT